MKKEYKKLVSFHVKFLQICLIFGIYNYLLIYSYHIYLQEIIGDDRNDTNNSLQDTL